MPECCGGCGGKDKATRKLENLPALKAWPVHVQKLLLPCDDCDHEVTCGFFCSVSGRGGEDGEGQLVDDASCPTSGIGSDDSGHSGHDEPKPSEKQKGKKKDKAGSQKAKKQQPKTIGLPGMAKTKAKPKAGAKENLHLPNRRRGKVARPA